MTPFFIQQNQLLTQAAEEELWMNNLKLSLKLSKF